MATNTGISTSTKDSNDVLDLDDCCFPCSKNGISKKAAKFCRDCKSNICVQCVKDHSKFPSLQSHCIEEKSTTGVPDKTFEVQGRRHRVKLTESCAEHLGRIIDHYCKDHDEVCCGTCVAINHRSCVNLHKIEESATDIDETEHDATREGLDKIISRIILQQDNRSCYLSNIAQAKNTILNDIDNFQDAMIKKIKELADESRKDVRSRHTDFVKDVESDVMELETALSKSDGSLKKLNSTDNDINAFIRLKKSKKVVKDVAAWMDRLSTNMKKRALDYCFDLDPFRNVTELKSFGHFEENVNTPYNAIKHEMVNVKLANEGDCVISGICLLENGIVAITDTRNKKLKMLNGNNDITESIVLPGSPFSLCMTLFGELVVTLRNEGKVQFVLFGDTLKLGSSFDTKQRCSGICYDTNNDELYVCCDSWARITNSKIRVYRRNGTLLRSLGNGLFSYPKNMTMETVSDMIYIADESNGLIALNRNGIKEWTFSEPKLKNLYGVCMLPGNQLLVSGSLSRNVVQVGADGNEVCELLDVNKGLVNPCSIACDKRNFRLVVGCASNEICIYALQRK